MSSWKFDDETLMAYADGELDQETAARVASAIEHDPELARQIDMFRATRQSVSDALGPVIKEAVPPSLALSVAAMIERDREARSKLDNRSEVVSLGAVRSRRRHVPDWLVPVAAVLILMAGGSAGYFLGTNLSPTLPAETASINDPAIIKALSEIPSGEALELPNTGRTIEPVLSFKLEDGTLCREYKVKGPDAKGIVSIACLEEDRWKTHLLMAATRPEEGFAPAGSAETIDAYLASIHAGSPLDGTAEDAALRSVRR